MAEEQKAGIGLTGAQLIEDIEGAQGVFRRNACPDKPYDGGIARDPKPMSNGSPVRGRESEFIGIDPVVHQGIASALKEIFTCDLAACPALTRRREKPLYHGHVDHILQTRGAAKRAVVAVHDARGNSGFFGLRGEDEAERIVRVNLNDIETVLR